MRRALVVTFYPEIFRVHLKELEHERRVHMHGWSRSAWPYCTGKDTSSEEVFVMVPGGCDEALHKPWPLGDLCHGWR